MTQTQYYVAASIDGFIADANGHLDWLYQFQNVEGVGPRYEAFYEDIGAVAMGAATYEFLLEAGIKSWPYAGRPAWVFTHRELPAFANADIRFTQEDLSVVHAQMVEAARGKNIWLVGGGNLVAQFAERGLLDEILLSVVPVVLGSGAPLLPASLTKPFDLEEVTRLGRGMLELRYRIPHER